MSLRARSLAFSYSDHTSIVHDVDLHLSPGFYGLVGANGAGKTTLLRLLAGELTPDSGSVQVGPEGGLVVLCAQRVDEPSNDIHALAAASDALALRLRGRLELDRSALARWETLSPGERKRWQIGAALWREPDVLLLDEPTNHLDADARATLVTALQAYRGIGVVVSHDRGLLDELTTATLRLARGTLRLYPGNYDAARREWEREERQKLREREQLEDEIRRLERQAAEARQGHAGAQRSLRGSRRMKNRHDHDSRSMGARNVVQWAEARAGRRVEVAAARLERAKGALRPVERDKTLGRSVFLGYQRAPKPRLLALELDVLRAGSAEVLRDVRVTLGREDRVRLAGPNGSGKSTLVRALLASATVPDERIVYLPQELTPDEGRRLLADVLSLPGVERGRVLSLVAALGIDPDRLLASGMPSPGEARKLLVALGLGRQAWGLVLDEPTNHLDLPSIERLEAALGAYPGALLLVTHDDALGRSCTRVTWRIAGGRLVVE